jgi:signal transduction histidine kinase
MKRELTAWSQRYAAALKKHLKQGPSASWQAARCLGRQAVSLGLETLGMARIHAEALATLEASSSRDGILKRAELFLAEAAASIEQTHRAALKANARLHRANQTLEGRTAGLAASNLTLKEGIAQCKTVELALKKSVEHSKTLWAESLALQKHLQGLTHRILSAQEHKRREISRELQDEIAQTLLGINVRLLTVRKSADRKDQGLQKEIGSTQKVVDQSAKSMSRLARQFGKAHEA